MFISGSAILIIFILTCKTSAVVSYHNCSDFVKDGCNWNRSSPFSINSKHGCEFSCSYDPKRETLGPVRLSVHLLSTIKNVNLFVSARQTHLISSWTLPIIFEEHGQNQPYNSIEELLCPPYTEKNDDLSFRIETSSSDVVNISVSLTRTQFVVKLNTSVKVTASPVSPWTKLYKWEEGQESVLISATSVGKSGGSVCTLLSIQNAECPVGANQADIMSGYGRYQSFQSKGGMIAKKSQFPDGVFIVILPLPDDRQCTGIEEGFQNKTSRSKTVEILVSSHLTMESKWLSFTGVGAVVAVIAIGSMVLVSFVIRKNLMENKEFFEGDDELLNLLVNEEVPSGEPIRREVSGGLIINGSSSSDRGTTTRNIDVQSSRRREAGISSDRRDEDFEAQALPQYPGLGIQGQLLALTEGNNAIMETSNGDLRIRSPNDILEAVRPSGDVPAEAINFTTDNNPRYIYWWKIRTEYENKKPKTNISNVGFKRNLFIVAVFMTLPLADILRAYMHVFSYKGSEDQCYYNTLCITSFGIFPDFARIFTNIGYILCGLCFLRIVKLHERLTLRISVGQTLGVSRSYGLFESLAWGLFIQGVMSSLYHVCPSRVTLRFDMMFMYVEAVILIVGIWGLRHGGVTHHVYPTVALIGAALLGAEAKDWVSYQLFWSVVVATHFFFTITIGSMLCTLGTWSFSPVSMYQIWKDMRPMALKLKEYLREENVSSTSHRTIIRTVFGIISNGIIMALGPALDMEVYLYILLVCIVNMVLYTMNYVVTKVFFHRERGTNVSWTCMVVSLTLWITAFIFFSVHNTNTETTAALSREMNSECILGNSFDSHDLWHLTSSFALFFSFLGILTMDDDLARRNPQKIAVF